MDYWNVTVVVSSSINSETTMAAFTSSVAMATLVFESRQTESLVDLASDIMSWVGKEYAVTVIIVKYDRILTG